jgi:hypothetical protein
MHIRYTHLFFVALFTLASACSTTKGSVGADGKSPWLAPSPNLRSQIAEQAERLPWTHGMERVELIQWFARVGEPAYPTLLEMVADPREDVAGAALAALGATRDSRLVEPLRRVELAVKDSPQLNLERARTQVRLGDWQSLPTLIAGLEDEQVMTRALCIQALQEATKERFDFDAKGEPEARAASVARWNEWLAKRSNDPLLGTPPAPTETTKTP